MCLTYHAKNHIFIDMEWRKQNKKTIKQRNPSRILFYFFDIFFDIFKMSIKNSIATTVSLELVLIDVNYSQIAFTLGGQCLRWIWFFFKLQNPPYALLFLESLNICLSLFYQI